MGYKKRLLLLIDATSDWAKPHLIEIEGANYEVPIYQLDIPKIVTLHMSYEAGWDDSAYNTYLTQRSVTVHFVLPQYVALLTQMYYAQLDFPLEEDRKASDKTLVALYAKACMASVNPRECLQLEVDRVAASNQSDSQLKDIQEALNNGWQPMPLVDILDSYFDASEENDTLDTERYLLEENPSEAIRTCWIYYGSDALDFLEAGKFKKKNNLDNEDLSGATIKELVHKLTQLDIADVNLEPIILVSRIAAREPILVELRSRGFKQSWTYIV